MHSRQDVSRELVNVGDNGHGQTQPRSRALPHKKSDIFAISGGCRPKILNTPPATERMPAQAGRNYHLVLGFHGDPRASASHAIWPMIAKTFVFTKTLRTYTIPFLREAKSLRDHAR
jgi:hypothetical protein